MTNMIVVVMHICRALHPSDCLDRNLNFEGSLFTTQECFTNGQIAMSKWAAENPNWIIMRWHCEVAGESAKL